MRTLALIAVLSASTLALLGAAPSHAQSTEQKVQGYVPPPMFGTPPSAQQRPVGPIVTPTRSNAVPAPLPPANAPGAPAPGQIQPTPPGYVKPRISDSGKVDAPLKVQPYIPKFPPMAPVPMEETPRGRGEIVERPRLPAKPPLPEKKPPAPVPAATPSIASSPAPAATPPAAVPTTPIETKVATPPATKETDAPAPAPLVTKETAQPAYKVSSKGVVTGPKTMPSVGVGGVEKLETFTPEPAVEKTLLEQHAERQQVAAASEPPPETEAAKALPVLPAGFAPLAQIEAIDASRSRMSLSFTAGQAALSEEQKLTVLHNIVPILSGDTGQRLMIQSYATPTDKGQSSDRRVALSRALAIRTALIDQGIEARRIDVRALGASTDQGPVDRADLILSSH